MSFSPWLRRLRSAFTPGRKGRPPRRRSAAHRPHLETLEDRCLLSLNPAVNYAVGSGPQAVVVADFNNDTRPDLAVGNLGDNTVSVLLGNADGTFQPALTSPAGYYPHSLAVGDFNADGKMDLVTANGLSYGNVLLGRGDGTFDPPTGILLGSSAASVAVGDFNADGKLDLGVLNNYYAPGYCGYYFCTGGYYYGEAVVLLGTGSGTFSGPTSSFLGGGYHTSAAVADFNGDGKLDFAATAEPEAVDVVLGDGTGSFGNPVSFYTGGFYSGSSLTASDLNKDGKVDLATVIYGNDAVGVLLGDGLGSFSSPQTYAAGSRPQSLAAADFNGDGNIDLVTANDDTNTVSVLLGTGTGAFQPPVPAAVGSSPSGVAVGDFNGDGRADAAATNFAANNVSVLLNDGAWPALNSPPISVNDVTVTEGNTGTVSATFTVSLSAASGQTVTVHYATADGTATAAGGDYQATSGTLTFTPGETSHTVTVPVNGDRLAESNESFLLVLTDPSNAFVADAGGLGVIVDDEPHVSIDYGPVYVTEGNSGTTTALFTVRLSNAYDAPVAVNFSTAEGDTEWWWGWYDPPPAATSGSDFQGGSGTVTFAPGETVKTIAIAVIGDRLGEPDEAFSVNLTGSPGATIDWGHAVGVIVDDEPRVSISNASVTEGNTGTAAMTFTVTLSAASDQPVTVTYATADGSATAGADYQATTGTLTFAPGETSKTLTVLVNGDRLGEYDEYFYVNLTGAEGAVVGYPATGYGTIRDDEPHISINSVSITEGKRGTKLMTFTVTLSAAYDQPVTVRYATQDGSAKAGEDYVATSGTLTFNPGQTTKTFTVAIKGDTKREADEYFYVLLSDASGSALIDNGSGLGSILNDDGGKGRR